ncbi:LysR family transcriptional regulator [Micromonospora coxensis]|uniref:LysR family transcriptional regulator n=1 Tax=Micromonospora coxensis TaxID=356852 RepID=UPI003439A610
MDVDLRDLELLEALDQHATLTAAAAHLFLSQPALSQRLIRLEERLGSPLFERRGRRLVATQAGERMLRAARTVLWEVRAATHDVREASRGRRQPVRLASQCAGNYQWLPPVLRAFRDRMPGVEVLIDRASDSEVIPALIAGDLDVAIVSKLDPRMSQVRLERLFDDELVAVVGANHEWAARALVRADDFADVHLVLYDAYDPARVPAVALPVPPDARPGRLTIVPTVTELLIETVVSTGAVSVLPSWTVAPFLRTHPIVTVRVDDPGQRRTWYCATRHAPRREQVDAFADLLRATLTGPPILVPAAQGTP